MTDFLLEIVFSTMHLLTQNKGICDKETSLWHKQDQLQNNLIGLDIPQALEKEAFFRSLFIVYL